MKNYFSPDEISLIEKNTNYKPKDVWEDIQTCHYLSGKPYRIFEEDLIDVIIEIDTQIQNIDIDFFRDLPYSITVNSGDNGINVCLILTQTRH